MSKDGNIPFRGVFIKGVLIHMQIYRTPMLMRDFNKVVWELY